jgi:hypothetical protein
MGSIDQLIQTQPFGTPAILNSVAGRNTQIESDKTAVSNATVKADDVFSQYVNTIDRDVGNVLIVKQAEGIREADLKNNTSKAIIAAGADPDTIVALTQQAGQEYQQALAARDKIAQKESVGFLDSPIEYLVNQVTLGQDYADYNAHVDKHNMMQNRIVALNTASSDIGKAVAATQESESLDTINRRAVVAAGALQDKSYQTQVEALKYDQNSLNELRSMSEEQIRNQMGAASLIRQDEDMEMRRKDFVLRQEELKQRAESAADEHELRRMTLKQREEEMASQAGLVEALNRGRATKGLPPLDAKTAINVLKMNNPIGAAANVDLAAGYTELSTQPRDANGNPDPTKQGIRSLGSDLSSAVGSILVNNAPGSSEGQRQVIKRINDLRDNVLLNPQNANIKPNVLADTVADDLKKEINNDKNNVPQGRGSLLEVPAPSVVLETNENLVKLPFVSKVIVPSVQQKGATDPTALVLRGVAEVKAGNLKVNDLIDGISQYYTQANQLNAAQKDLNAFGITAPSTYNVKLDVGVPFVGPVDLVNKAKVTAVIMSRLRYENFGSLHPIEGVTDWQPTSFRGEK